MRAPHQESPLNPVPPVVWLLLMPLVAVEAAVSLGASGLAGGGAGMGWRLEALERFSFAPQILQAMIAQGRFPPEHLARLVTYPFVHASFTQTLFVGVFLLALGKMVAEVFRPLAVIAIFFGAAIAGALAYTLLPWSLPPLFGGYPAVYGLIGAFTFILWARLGAVQANRYRAFTLIGILLAMQLVFGLIFGGSWIWVAEVAGFATGFLLSFLVAPGGPGRVLALLRRR